MEVIAGYLKDFNEKKGFFTGDQKMNKYFKSNYSNSDQQEVFLKVTAIDDDFSKQLKRGLLDFARFISQLNLDHFLESGDSNSVDRIIEYSHIENHSNLLQFASTYCNLHNNDAFPIYHHKINKLLTEHLAIKYLNSDFSYLMYSKGMIDFKNQLGLSSLNFLEFNKFLWLYSADIFNDNE